MRSLEGLNPRQREVVEHGDGPLLVLAGAGSGKTRALTHRIAHLIEARGVPPTHILAVTFTNKAAGEMRERIQHLLGDAGRGVWAGTFHSICLRLLRMYGGRIGLGSDFTVYDESDRMAVLKRIVREQNLGEGGFDPRSLANSLSSLKNQGIDPRDPDAELTGPMSE
ncbi:MAG: UvrD-helicase domain-containing protein, partial [Myxococcales bacterium]|nr:UvrD-helicase domain-containing protein [Myxococcales bacterium]